MNARDRIIKKRKELGLNQTELAKRAGLKAPAISQYESGARNPSYDALIRLANALNVKVDYLVSGDESFNNELFDLKSEVLLKMYNGLSVNDQSKIFDYALSLSGYNNSVSDVFFKNAKGYAEYVFEKLNDKLIPVDVYAIAKRLNVTIIKGDLDDAEAMLLKRSNMIILNKNVIHESRIKFGIASLLGHLIMPWHTKDIYYHRKSNESTTSSTENEKIEVNSFTTNLITPSAELEKDFSQFDEKNVSLEVLETIATKKYDVSLHSFCYRLVEYNESRFACIVSKDNKIGKVVSGCNLLKEEDDDLDRFSQAYSLLSNSGDEKEFKEDKVPASAWLSNARENDFIYESTVYNPDFKSTLTLLTIKN
ncbi:helix-turn-helix domain-containing protein [Bacillus toyonensis]|uniref:helix-turn-helix domain-containing protein n=1 Tax=Bacillus toyonensis TaxID=155322 RepID=UPI000BEC82DF|nr:helix-turn-helix transcriptional regulator [Bacillus toyonensis]PED58961.1 hypothetical protein CON89_23205 [Bacillus toyonensis]PEJ91425.1 hypothetical protein CN687_19955 [Bacillus toyonensis]PGC99077.1 hypothetical protein COM26_05970 [Bacillus toyonensis]PGD74317.1 hypothetical protein COM36_28760 [Bacillus toyonensis]PGE84620.1 hypothetical protein COM75_29835 [Bacillus toyonensis]